MTYYIVISVIIQCIFITNSAVAFLEQLTINYRYYKNDLISYKTFEIDFPFFIFYSKIKYYDPVRAPDAGV